MTDAEFVEETAKLEKYYGKELEKFQLKIWHEEIGHISVARYRQIIKQIFKTSKFMPKLADIIEINSVITTENNQTVREIVDCDKCKGRGFILYTKMFDNGVEKIPYEYLAKCNCANGDQYNYNGMTIQDATHRSTYYVPNVVELGI